MFSRLHSAVSTDDISQGDPIPIGTVVTNATTEGRMSGDIKGRKQYSDTPSVRGNFWLLPNYSAELIERIGSYHSVSSVVASFIALRHGRISDNQSLVATCFLDPKIKHLMVDPCRLKDMKEALLVAFEHIRSNNKIAIFADYDVDGACSSALLYCFLLKCGVLPENILVHVPDRRKEGYGPNIDAMSSFAQWGAKLIISVDCGIVAFEPIAHARELGCDFIVIDHHKSAATMPNANAVVNPNRTDEDQSLDLGYLSAAGVTFMFCAGLANHFPDLSAELKGYLMASLDLVAISTICDVVPLLGLNRAFVKHGLRIINQRVGHNRIKTHDCEHSLVCPDGSSARNDNQGLNGSYGGGGSGFARRTGLERPAVSAIFSRQNVGGTISAKEIGFKLGPVINACGRVGESIYGFKALTASGQEESDRIVSKMLEWNRLRIDTEARIAAEALERIDRIVANDLEREGKNFIFVYDKDWDEGVIGIVASRVQERYSCLAIVGVLSRHEDGHQYVKASCRSCAGVDVGAIVLSGLRGNILVKGGGHKMAAGFTVRADKVNDFTRIVDDMVSEMSLLDGRRELTIDCILSPDSIGDKILSDIDLLGPFGPGNEAILFLVPDVMIVSYKLVGKEHVSVVLKNPFSSLHFHAICFRCIGTPLGDCLIDGVGKTFSIVCNIEPQEYLSKRTASVVIVDALPRH